MANSADPDQLAFKMPLPFQIFSQSVTWSRWSGSALFAKAVYIRVQQDKG